MGALPAFETCTAGAKSSSTASGAGSVNLTTPYLARAWWARARRPGRVLALVNLNEAGLVRVCTEDREGFQGGG
jgi:hypothetical protein